MGMFDNFTVKVDLPLPEELKVLNLDWKSKIFQTKSLDNCLLDFFVAENGELFEHVVEKDYIPYSEEEKKALKTKPWDIWKDVVEKHQFDKKINLHGKVNFYTYENYDDMQDFWLEFEAYFSYGKLDKIELVSFYKEESLKIRNGKIQEQYEKQQKLLVNRLKKYANYIGWRFVWRKIARLLLSMGKTFNNASYFIHRHII
jgi:hypothetical protein